MNISECFHPANKRVICHREGTVVCEECDLKIYSEDNFFPKQTNILHDVVENNFLPPNVIPKTLHQFKKRKNRGELDLAHSLYTVLKSSGSARTIEEIANMFNLKETDLWKIGRVTDDITCIKPSDLLARMDTSSLTSHEKKKIERDADYFSQYYSIAPKTLLAASWYIATNESMKNVAKKCFVSPTSIARTIKRISAHDSG